jgi:hypothetical protein
MSILRVLSWPFVAIWHLVTWILGLTGRIVVIVVGLALMITGLVATLTVIGAVVGVPLLLVGLLLVFRGIF